MNAREWKAKILHLVAHKARLVPWRLVLAAFWPQTASGRRNGRRDLAAWQGEGLLTLFTARVRRVDRVGLLHLDAGRPDDPLPDCEALAAELRRRWQALEEVPTRLLMATPRLVRRLGGACPARVTHEDCLSHDAGLGTLLLSLLRSAPRLYEAFVTEDALPVRPFTVNPDGYFASSDGPATVVEFCGSSYDADRLAKIVRFARSERLGCQLWSPAAE